MSTKWLGKLRPHQAVHWLRAIWQAIRNLRPRRAVNWLRAIWQAIRNLPPRRAIVWLLGLGVVFGLGIVTSQAWPSGNSNNAAAPDPNTFPTDPPPTSPTAPATTPSPTNRPVPDPSPDPEPEPTPAPPTPTSPTPTSPLPTEQPSPTAPATTATPEPLPTPVFIVLDRQPPTFGEALEVASVLAPHVVEPSDCRSPLPHPNLMPNWPRTYRSGTHQGLDYQCFMRGRIAVAAMDGRVAVAVGDFDDPAPDDRDALLDTAAQLDRTPPHTLTMLYGNYVVLDHGVIDGAGHVVTIYSHLEAVNSNLRIGQMVSAGDRLATIGNRGTSAAAAGDFDFDPHLHWELHVDDLYLAAGLTPDQTRQVYETLFSDSG